MLWENFGGRDIEGSVAVGKSQMEGRMQLGLQQKNAIYTTCSCVSKLVSEWTIDYNIL